MTLSKGKSPTEARRENKGKPRIDLIPPEAIFALAEVLEIGAHKYDERDWEKGMNWSHCFSASMRHLWKWWSRKEKDEESGLTHLKHALWNVMALLTYEERKIGKDNRP